MKINNNNVAATGFTRREGLFALVGAVAGLSGCGGGGGSDVASVGSGGTGSFSSGAITGFGSIIVNGVRFDDSQARITDDNGGLRSSADLKLGMVVAVSASSIIAGVNGSTASASSITFSSELKGPIDSLGSQTLVVLGQIVRLTASTVFDNSIAGGQAGLGVSQIIEVHGFVDPATNQITATRIERETGTTSFKLQGTVQSLNTAARTFVLGTLTISYAGVAAAGLPANLANGLLVRVGLAIAPTSGARTAISVRAVSREVEDHAEAEVDGTVTAFTSSASFSVNGLSVDASKAVFRSGTAGLALGARVEVKGSVSNGVLVAIDVQVETESEIENQEFELRGAVSSLNTTSKTFVVRGVTVNYANTSRFDNGDASKLALFNGTSATVEVRGTYNAATNSVAASRIKFES
jgi:hypothetical protein